MKCDLAEKLFDFAVDVIGFIRRFPRSPEYRVISYQLCKAATSSGANYEKASAGSSRQDFICKTEISLREMKASNYWLRIIRSIGNEESEMKERCEKLIDESSQLSKILASIVVSAKKRVKDRSRCLFTFLF
ncbi:four helix bundle protein [Prosthecochloris sp. GSB1]|uniref:four helix bundle protein n=1 Tax=Prosthecochloris sp. GSB1 TaxID=281093 RepID=UPI000B8CC6E5|nr:four helix bundle protein [Prosthecochloris sp. GSB1]ASQ89982.1 four helix bundle protein [Prosthecochloris sp. GSB1]